MIGSLMYLTSSRLDIMFSVCACSRFQVQPKVFHLNAVKRIFRYLKGRPNFSLWYPKDSPFILEAFSDNDYASVSLDRKSTTGGCQFLGSRLISWQCKKHIVVVNSTNEAEYIAASHCWGQVLWIQNQMLDYGYNFMQTKIHDDKESVICVVKNPVYHSKTKHIEIRHHFIRDSYEKRLIEMVKIHTNNNVADLLTKAFDTSVPQDLEVDEDVHKEESDSMERAITTAASLDAAQDNDNIIKTQTKAMTNTRSERVLGQPIKPPLSEGHTSGSGESMMEHQFELMANVLDLEKRKDAQAVEILRLKKRMMHPNRGGAVTRQSHVMQLLKWKLHENCGVHTLFMDGTPMEINMLVEKKYPLIKELLEKMLNLRRDERSLNNNSFLGEYESSSLALDKEERRDEKKRLDHLKQDQTMLVIKRFSKRKKFCGGEEDEKELVDMGEVGGGPFSEGDGGEEGRL
ncbi:hypothetical protein Tco_1011158 [Tanacetum coccineum]